MLDEKELIENVTPTHFYLSQNYPNPFREGTTIKFCIGSTVRVKLIVFNGAGEEIIILVDEEKDPGTYEVKFSVCHSREGGNPKEGVYYYRLKAGDYKCEKEMEIIR